MVNTPDVQKAVAQLKDQDLRGLESLVRRYQVKAVRSVYLVTADRSQAEDIVQTAFLQVATHINQYDPQRPFEPWFFRIVMNLALQAVRKARRETSLDAPLSHLDGLSLADLIADDTPHPEQMAENGELKAAIRVALEALSPDQRTAVVMRYYLDMHEQEMAEVLSTPRGTVKWRLHQARRQLRGLLSVFQPEVSVKDATQWRMTSLKTGVCMHSLTR